MTHFQMNLLDELAPANMTSTTHCDETENPNCYQPDVQVEFQTPARFELGHSELPKVLMCNHLRLIDIIRVRAARSEFTSEVK